MDENSKTPADAPDETPADAPDDTGLAFLASIDAAPLAERAALVTLLADAIDTADGARPVIAYASRKLASALDVLDMLPDPGIAPDELAAVVERAKRYATTILPETGSTKTARATGAVSVSVAGQISAKGPGFAKRRNRAVKADDASSWNSARDALAKELHADADSDEQRAVKRALDAWIADDVARTEPLVLDGNEFAFDAD